MCKRENVNAWFNYFKIIRHYFHLLTQPGPRGFPWFKGKERPFFTWLEAVNHLLSPNKLLRKRFTFHYKDMFGRFSFLERQWLLWKELQVKFNFNQLWSFELCNIKFEITWILNAIWFRFLRLIKKLYCSRCFFVRLQYRQLRRLFFFVLSIHLGRFGVILYRP